MDRANLSKHSSYAVLLQHNTNDTYNGDTMHAPVGYLTRDFSLQSQAAKLGTGELSHQPASPNQGCPSVRGNKSSNQFNLLLSRTYAFSSKLEISRLVSQVLERPERKNPTDRAPYTPQYDTGPFTRKFSSHAAAKTSLVCPLSGSATLCMC